jgi:hypothetical protein
MMDRIASILREKGKIGHNLWSTALDGAANTRCSDGNIRYFEYENDKFEFLAEYKSADPQRGMAFLPRRGVNVSTRSEIAV